jgi:AbrB family looped-hinge helix DNA binding protein
MQGRGGLFEMAEPKVRKLDDIGRISIPAEIRNELDIGPGTPFEIKRLSPGIALKTIPGGFKSIAPNGGILLIPAEDSETI